MLPERAQALEQFAVRGGADLSDVPVEFLDGVAIENVSVAFTEVKSALSIAVERAQRSGPATIAVFPHDPTMQHAQSRRTEFRAVDPESIVLESLPPGDYLVVAVADVAPPRSTATRAELARTRTCDNDPRPRHGPRRVGGQNPDAQAPR